MKSSLVEQLDIIPPFVVRRLARRPRSLEKKHGKKKRISTKEIAEGSGLSVNTVAIISRKKTWAGIKVGTADAFAKACGHDLLRPRRNLQYLKRFLKTGRGFRHLTRQEMKQFARIIRML